MRQLRLVNRTEQDPDAAAKRRLANRKHYTENRETYLRRSRERHARDKAAKCAEREAGLDWHDVGEARRGTDWQRPEACKGNCQYHDKCVAGKWAPCKPMDACSQCGRLDMYCEPRGGLCLDCYAVKYVAENPIRLSGDAVLRAIKQYEDMKSD